MSAQENASLAHDVYSAFNQGDLSRAAGVAADDVEVELIPFGLTFHGRQGFTEFMQGFKTAFPDLTVQVVNQVATEDQVANECTWSGTHSGPLRTPSGEIPPTGRKVEGGRFCEVWRVHDGRLVSLRNYQDPAPWLRQLGVLPEPEQSGA